MRATEEKYVVKTQRKVLRALVGATALALAAAGCSGGGGTSATPPAAAVATAAPTTTPTTAPTTAPLAGPLIYPLAAGASAPAPGTIGVSTATVQFNAPNQVASFLVSEPGQTTPFTIQGCNNKAPITFNFQYPVSNGATIIELTSIKAGTCAVLITDSANNTASVLVDVTTISASVQ